jgi:hypothetical protein
MKCAKVVGPNCTNAYLKSDTATTYLCNPVNRRGSARQPAGTRSRGRRPHSTNYQPLATHLNSTYT